MQPPAMPQQPEPMTEAPASEGFTICIAVSPSAGISVYEEPLENPAQESAEGEGESGEGASGKQVDSIEGALRAVLQIFQQHEGAKAEDDMAKGHAAVTKPSAGDME